ncbi:MULTISPECIES: tail fiber domain-containing protein [unclassified Streptomyces]|uniref:tail fiber domain-containing protein n=1 Tax=unclassified Streptomyces TaxID=2593676 RepID=UPI0033B981BB
MWPFRRSGAATPVAATPAADTAVTTASAEVTSTGAVNGYHVLATVAALPVSTWRYLWEPEHVRHIGPMSQDWHAAFDFQHANTSVIPLVDANGVAMVCIQALNRRIDELTAEVRGLREITAQHARSGR